MSYNSLQSSRARNHFAILSYMGAAEAGLRDGGRVGLLQLECLIRIGGASFGQLAQDQQHDSGGTSDFNHCGANPISDNVYRTQSASAIWQPELK